jgi:hypothetical protein
MLMWICEGDEREGGGRDFEMEGSDCVTKRNRVAIFERDQMARKTLSWKLHREEELHQ